MAFSLSHHAFGDSEHLPKRSVLILLCCLIPPCSLFSLSVSTLLGSVHEDQLPDIILADGHGLFKLLLLQCGSFGLHDQPTAGGK